MQREMCAELSSLISGLSSLSAPLCESALAKHLEGAKFTREAIASYISFGSESYTRNSIFKSEHLEILVLTWLSGQMTPIHNHKNSACAFLVVEGVATEISYERSLSGRLVPTQVSRLERGKIASSYDDEMHIMGNFEDPSSPLVTLHCYSPPLNGMEIFSGADTYFDKYNHVYDIVFNRLTSKNSGLVQEDHSG